MRLAKGVGNQVWYDKFRNPAQIKPGEEIPDWILKKYVVNESLIEQYPDKESILLSSSLSVKNKSTFLSTDPNFERHHPKVAIATPSQQLRPTVEISNVTGIVVCCDTRVLMEISYNSVRKFYSDMPIIIIDCSDPNNSCVPYIRSLASPMTTVIRPGTNIGHGPGMNLGISHAKTRYALLFDTDVELLEPCVGDMLDLVEEDTFGVGYVIPTAFSGFGTWYPAPPPKEGGWMPYLHPYFHLIDINNFKKFPPYTNSGAPCTPTMLAIYKQGLSSKIIKQFKDMANGTPKFVKHDGGGTCRRDPKLCT